MKFDKKYHIDIPIYELKYAEDNEWNTITEKAALEDLFDSFERITPIITEMLLGKEINTQRGIFRIKNYLKLNRAYQFKRARF